MIAKTSPTGTQVRWHGGTGVTVSGVWFDGAVYVRTTADGAEVKLNAAELIPNAGPHNTDPFWRVYGRVTAHAGDSWYGPGIVFLNNFQMAGKHLSPVDTAKPTAQYLKP